MSFAETKLAIAKLNSRNYYVWKYKIEMLLTRDNLWDIVNETPPLTERSNEWNSRNRQAMATIGLSVEDDHLIHVRKCSNAWEMWLALKRLYERDSVNNKLYLLRKMYQSKLVNEHEMGPHINKILEIVEQLRSMGEIIQDSHIAALLLSSLPESYGPLITSMEGRPQSELTLDFVKSRIMDEYERRRENRGNTSNVTDTALKTSKFNQPKGKRETRSCYYCGKTGHLKFECRSLKARDKSTHRAKAATVDQDKSLNNHEQNDDLDDEYFCFTASKADIIDGWYIDSGATGHMSNNKELFNEIEPFESPVNVRVADGRTIEALGQGSIYLYSNLQTSKAPKVRLDKVLYVPALEGNLLSVKKLAQLGYKITFEGTTCKIARDNIDIINGNLDNNLYKLNNTHQALHTNHATHTNCIHTWHRRMGHRDPRALWKLMKNNSTQDLKITNCPIIKTCEECIKGKMASKPYPKQSLHRSDKPYVLLHSDITGPMKTPTPAGNRYLATITDDHSRYTEVFPLKNKNEINQKIRDYLQKWNNHFGRKPSILRSDGGGEYINNELDNYLRQEGIRRQITIPYSPAQNGVSERKNRTIIEMTRCMLLDAGLENKYWAEAANTATYLHNRLPSSACVSTPFEMWFGHKPNLGHIKIFGSKAYARLPNEKLGKLDIRTQTGIMVGYSDTSKGYRILIPTTGKIIVSRNVIFNERLDQEENLKAIPLSTGNEQPETQPEENCPNDILIPLTSSETAPSTNIKDNLRRSTRCNKGIPADKLTYSAQIQHDSEPETWTDITKMNTTDKQKWITAINEEIESFEENNVWNLVPLPEGKTPIGCKWTFKIKRDSNDKIARFKARLVAKGYSQKPGSDYSDTYAPVVKFSTVRTLLTIAASRKMTTRHLDVKCAFLNGDLAEEIYLEQPEGPSQQKDENLVYRLNKAVYGLKQSANVWNKKINDKLTSMGFKRGKADQCLYSKNNNGTLTYILIYVDDLLICGDRAEDITTIQQTLENIFQMKDLGEAKYYLGIQIDRNQDGTFFINQSNKINKLVHDFRLEESKSTYTPMETDFLRAKDQYDKPTSNHDLYRKAVGALLHLSTVTRPDISAATGFLGRKVSDPNHSHWMAAKRVMKYLKTTVDLGITIKGSDDLKLECYTDSDWAGDGTDRKSTSGYIFLLGNNPISWCSRKQTCTAQSSTEAEYVAAAAACQELMWLRSLMDDFGYPQTEPITMHEDNQGCISLAETEKTHTRTKHIDVKYHVVKDMQHQGIINLQYCATECMLADILTKPLGRNKFEELKSKLGIGQFIC